MTLSRTPTTGRLREAVVWIDHERAVIVEARHRGPDHVEIIDRRSTDSDTTFEARTVDGLHNADRVLVSGPTGMRTEFERTYVAMTHRPDRLIDVELDMPGIVDVHATA